MLEARGNTSTHTHECVCARAYTRTLYPCLSRSFTHTYTHAHSHTYKHTCSTHIFDVYDECAECACKKYVLQVAFAEDQWKEGGEVVCVCLCTATCCCSESLPPGGRWIWPKSHLKRFIKPYLKFKWSGALLASELYKTLQHNASA